MTRLGPLTSQALGRSPYDIVVQGEGTADGSAPTQDFDERGRPVNAETKRINRDIVRSHNEVMHVIGVAEPDSGMLTADAEVDKRLMQQHYEDQVGQRLWGPARVLGVVGVWGADPLRQRILLYRRYSEHMPWRKFRQDYGLQTTLNVLTTGLPVFMVDNWLRHASLNREDIRTSFWKRAVVQYVRLHLQVFACLQRLDIITAFPWIPGPLFFVPFSSQSPISRPPPFPTSPTVRSVAQWVGLAVLNVAPLAAFYGYTELRDRVTHRLNYAIFAQQEVPSNPPLERPVTKIDPHTGERRLAGLPPIEVVPPRPPVPPPPQPAPSQRPSIPPPPAESQRLSSGPDGSRHNAIDSQAAETETDTEMHAAPSLSEAQPAQRPSATPPPASPTTARRRNTVSSGGGDDGYISEEEEFELSATLISFDVEAAEAGDTPPNAWSAELRQSTSTGGYDADAVGPFGGSAAHGTYIRGVYYPGNSGRFFADNMLTRLPAAIHADGAAVLAASIVLAPCEASIIRLLARTYRLRNRLPLDDLYGVGVLPFVHGSGISWNAANHFALVVLMYSVVHAAGVLTAVGLGRLYRGSQQGWSFFRVVKENLWYRDTGKSKET